MGIFLPMDLWAPGRSLEADAAIRRWEYSHFIQDTPEPILESLIGMTKAHHRPDRVWVENMEMEERELAWRRQVEGPFR